MAFSLDRFQVVRPYLYHLTARTNLEQMRKSRRIFSAALLLEQTDNKHWLTERREKPVQIVLDGESISIRDQYPLHRGNLSLEVGWEFPAFVHHLNKHVFFWPGSAVQPIDYGIRHFQRYDAEDTIILKVPFTALQRQNPDSIALFCKYNSGSPRRVAGRASPRGASTFSPASEVGFTPGEVVEVVFRDQVDLPVEVQFSESLAGPWKLI